jgi:hypothetical protein
MEPAGSASWTARDREDESVPRFGSEVGDKAVLEVSVGLLAQRGTLGLS